LTELAALLPPLDCAPCPVCGRASALYDVVDFSRSCEEVRQRYLPLTGVPVYYNRCGACGHCFAPAFRAWSSADFARHVYNEGYAGVDPDYAEVRPANLADLVHGSFGAERARVRHLDYGAGNGELSRRLRARGWTSDCWDPYGNAGAAVPQGRYQLVTAFEVFEHAPDPATMLPVLKGLLEDDGMLLLSTLLSDGEIHERGRLTWWYAAPRNGHVSLFSRASLARLATAFGLRVESLNSNLHLMYERPPRWAMSP
jgi:hypothetical protein